MRIKKFTYYIGDFETTVFAGQEYTEVWASAVVEMESNQVLVFHSIDDTFEFFVSLPGNICVFYHNLKFDGSFWLYFLMVKKKLKQAVLRTGTDINQVKWLHDADMPNNSFKYSISARGQWYTIIIRINGKFIEFRDSLKLLPFSVKEIGNSFGTEHKKLEMEYKGFRYAGCLITDEEKAYIRNDVLVMKEALEIMFEEGHNKLTIGSCCLSEYKNLIGGKSVYEMEFPDLYQVHIDEKIYGSKTVGDYIHGSYKGGWCYLVKGAENRIYHNGLTADVNSLYPYVMHSESGNRFPIGYPEFWRGNYIPPEAQGEHKYYFIRIKTRFYLKNGYLPFVQIKNSLLYKGTEALESTDVDVCINPRSKNKKWVKRAEYTDLDGNKRDTRVILTLTMTDYILLKEHYKLVDFEILDGCYFTSVSHLFNAYINKYRDLKMTSKGAKRQLAKLFLNNLYGKFASSPDSSFKFGYEKNDNVSFYDVHAEEKIPGYIPIGSAITSYAREYTIRAAQKNYHGADQPGFKYADTDSIHCDFSPSELKGVKIDNKIFGCWKIESCWDYALFVRQKTYIEHVVMEDLEELPVEKQYLNIKCAGMNDRCKNLFKLALTGFHPHSVELSAEEKQIVKTYLDTEEITDDQFLFLNQKDYKLTDFKRGLCVPGKLLPKRIPGGTVLLDTFYEMR